MKKKYLWLLVAVGLVAVAVIGGTLASGYKQSDKMNLTMNEKALSVSVVNENNEKVDEDQPLGESVLPGAKIQLNRSVYNSQEDGYDIYARVRIYYSWDNVDDTKAYEDKVFSMFINNTPLVMSTSYSQAEVTPEGWLVVESEPGEIVMYYTKPIPSGESQTFLDSLMFDTDMDNIYAGAELTLTYEVDAVQAGNKDVSVAEDAIAAEWGVFATIEGNEIVNVSETDVEE